MRKKLSVLIGFPVGIMILMISYVLIYLIVGEEQYVAELSRIVDPNVLINQLIWSGVVYVIYFMVYKYLIKNIENTDEPAKFVISTFVIMAFVYIISVVADKFGKFSEDLVLLLVGIGLILLMIIAIVCSILNGINIHKINKALNKRNCSKKE